MKKKIVIIAIILTTIALAGCTESSTRPPYHPSDYDAKITDVEVQVDSFLFNFSEVVLENGSVTNATDKIVSIRMLNYGNLSAEEIKFEIQQLPPDLQVWATEIFCDYDVTVILYQKGETGAFLFHEIIPDGRITVDIRIGLHNASEWTYKDDELYTILLRCSWKGRIEKHCSQGNTYYKWTDEEITIPLKVRT